MAKRKFSGDDFAEFIFAAAEKLTDFSLAMEDDAISHQDDPEETEYTAKQFAEAKARYIDTTLAELREALLR